MRRLFERTWFGIALADVAPLSESVLPASGFYEAFYRELFSRYASYAELDATWRKRKEATASWIAGQSTDGSAKLKVLSIGCGIGYVEYLLHRFHGMEVHAADFATAASTWLRATLPPEHIHQLSELGDFAGHFDLIYLSEVDYAVPTGDLVRLLAQQRNLLRPNARCALITAEYYGYPRTPLGRIRDLERRIRDLIKAGLAALRLRNRGQFWGWARTPQEFRSIMQAAGYSKLEDGLVDLHGRSSYFIRGQA